MRKLLLAAAVSLAALPAAADGPFPPITSETVNKECAECHVLFRPQMLPKKSWEVIMDGLSDHFGEDASLDGEILKEVRDYHVAHASDVENHRRARKFLAGVDLNNPPLKVTDTPRFIIKHKGIPDAAYAHKAVKSKARCDACHLGTKDGDFGDDNVQVPGYAIIFGLYIKKFW